MIPSLAVWVEEMEVLRPSRSANDHHPAQIILHLEKHRTTPAKDDHWMGLQTAFAPCLGFVSSFGFFFFCCLVEEMEVPRPSRSANDHQPAQVITPGETQNYSRQR